MEVRVRCADLGTGWSVSGPGLRRGYGFRGAQREKPAVSRRAGPRTSRHERSFQTDPTQETRAA